MSFFAKSQTTKKVKRTRGMTIMRKRMTTDTRNEHPSDTESGSFSFRDWLADQLRQAQTLEGGVSHSSTCVRHNDQFQNSDIRQFNLIFLDLAYCVRGTKIPLLPHNFSKRAPVIRRPPQDELLGTLCLSFLEDERDVFESLRDVED